MITASESHHVSEGVKRCHICECFISPNEQFQFKNHPIVWYCESFWHRFSYVNAFVTFHRFSLRDGRQCFASDLLQRIPKNRLCVLFDDPSRRRLITSIITDQGTASSEQEGTVKAQISGTCIFKAQTPTERGHASGLRPLYQDVNLSGCKCLEVPLLLQRRPTPHLADV